MKQRNERIRKSNNGKEEIIHTWIKYFFFLVTLFIFFPAVSLADDNKIFKENSKAVVVVTAYDEKGNAIRHGSGFIVRQDGVVVTNYHVIGMAKDIKVKASNTVLDVEGLIFIDKENDLVLLKTKVRSMPVVKLGVVGKENIGEQFYIIGRPSGFENAISVGLLSEIRRIGEKVEILRMTAAASPGMSGSPVVNRNGEVVGVVTSGSSALHNFSSAISVKLIKGKISSESVTAIKESWLEDYINSATYWNSFGLAYYESGKYKDAIDAYKQTIKVDPDYTDAHLNLGVAYLKSHKQKNAIEALKRLIRIDPDNTDAHLNICLAYLLLNDRGSAIEQYKILEILDSEKADGLFNVIYK